MGKRKKTDEEHRIIVLGGQGFIGSHVVRSLRRKSRTVIAASRRSHVDILDLPQLENFFQTVKPTIIINCAAHKGSVHYVTKYAADIADDNLRMFLNLYSAVKAIVPQAMVINPISNCTYPGNSVIQKEGEWWNGAVHKSVWAFANTKRMWQVISECYAMQYGIRTKNYIVPNAFGPGDYLDPIKTHALNGMVIRMIQAKWKKSSEFQVWGTGKPMREWIYVKDLARFLSDVSDDTSSQIDPVNVAQNMAYSVAETALLIKEYIGYKGQLTFDTSFQDGAPIKQLDASVFTKTFPKFTFTPFHKGIKETVKYYLKALK